MVTIEQLEKQHSMSYGSSVTISKYTLHSINYMLGVIIPFIYPVWIIPIINKKYLNKNLRWRYWLLIVLLVVYVVLILLIMLLWMFMILCCYITFLSFVLRMFVIYLWGRLLWKKKLGLLENLQRKKFWKLLVLIVDMFSLLIITKLMMNGLWWVENKWYLNLYGIKLIRRA